MADISTNNRRIARNTILLYFRMFISMAVSLYTSRVILQTLGVNDYGIYNVVGGVVGMFSFINSTMSNATSRFLTFEIGKDNQKKLSETFNAAFLVHLIIAAIVFLLCESIGLWFLNNKMVVPQERLFAAHVVFQLSIVSTVISITQVPYNAVLIAHEKMDIYAYVELVNVFLKLGILYLLVILSYDKLILYSILSLLVGVCILLFYRMYGRYKYEECRLSLKWQTDVIKPMLSFSGLDFYGNMAVTARTQGVTMLLNVFFGPVANAASGIAASVQSAVMSFASNINTAVRPQIIKYYAQGNYKEMESLINTACKFNFLILAIIIVPLCCEIKYILNLWLGNVPEMTEIFCILTLLFNLFANISFLVVTGIHAYGNIVRPSFINGTLYLMVVPLSYLSFKIGGAAWTSFLFNVVAVIIGMLSNVYTLHLYVPEYSFKTFLCDVLSRCLLVLLAGIIAAMLITMNMESSFSRLIITSLSSFVIMGVLGWYLMIPYIVKKKIVMTVKEKIRNVI